MRSVAFVILIMAGLTITSFMLEYACAIVTAFYIKQLPKELIYYVTQCLGITVDTLIDILAFIEIVLLGAVLLHGRIIEYNTLDGFLTERLHCNNNSK